MFENPVLINLRQSWINFAWSSTLGRVAGHIPELAFFLTRRAYIGRCGCCMEESAVAAFPKSQTAVRTDVSGEFVIGGETAVGALKFFLFVFHLLTSKTIKSRNTSIKHKITCQQNQERNLNRNVRSLQRGMNRQLNWKNRRIYIILECIRAYKNSYPP